MDSVQVIDNLLEEIGTLTVPESWVRHYFEDKMVDVQIGMQMLTSMNRVHIENGKVWLS